MSDLRICRKCKHEREESEFPLWGGKAGNVCDTCKPPKAEADAKIPPAKSSKRKVKAVPTVPELSLSFPAGYGFSAETVDNQAVRITQLNEDGTGESIVLSRAEFWAISEHFGPWSQQGLGT